MPDERHIVIGVECPYCKTKQKVHVASPLSSKMASQTLPCIRCRQYFAVALAGKILAGPFPP